MDESIDRLKANELAHQAVGEYDLSCRLLNDAYHTYVRSVRKLARRMVRCDKQEEAETIRSALAQFMRNAELLGKHEGLFPPLPGK